MIKFRPKTMLAATHKYKVFLTLEITKEKEALLSS